MTLVYSTAMKRSVTIEKRLGETPLQAIERFRADTHLGHDVPLAYAGRLDPMATGKLLILIGDECKVQTTYHSLDKQYEFEVLSGFQSDTHDVLGIAESAQTPSTDALRALAQKYTGTITLPYPHFSARTVGGVPLHMHTLSGTLADIDVPTKTSTVYSLQLTKTRTLRGGELLKSILEKINSFPEVTDERKALGRDFRRAEIRARWH
ncbi:MAG: tRNA pseudouridine synthase tRNA pseudouridine55 synthase, partial [Candidatus Parcubacteria bacterium]